MGVEVNVHACGERVVKEGGEGGRMGGEVGRGRVVREGGRVGRHVVGGR